MLRTHLTFLTLTLAVAVLTCRETKPTSAVRPRVQETNEALARAALRPSLGYPSVARFDSLITHCDHSDGGCLQVVEDSQLPLAGGRAYRDSVGLHLRLRDGTFLLLADDTSEGSSSVHYSFHAYIQDLGYYLVHEAYYEGSSDGLVSERSGRLTTLIGLPVFSPNRSRFVVAMPYDREVGPPSGIAVYRIDSTEITEEWSQPLTTWEPSAPRWLSDTLVRVQRQDTDSLRMEPTGPISTMLLRSTRGTWTLEAH